MDFRVRSRWLCLFSLADGGAIWLLNFQIMMCALGSWWHLSLWGHFFSSLRPLPVHSQHMSQELYRLLFSWSGMPCSSLAYDSSSLRHQVDTSASSKGVPSALRGSPCTGCWTTPRWFPCRPGFCGVCREHLQTLCRPWPIQQSLLTAPAEVLVSQPLVLTV